MKKILFITPYPVGVAGSQRFRFEQYFEILTKNGFQYEVSSFLDQSTWEILYQKGHFFQKIFAIIRGYLRRIRDVMRMKKFDVIFIHREVSPFGLPFFEWLLMKVSGKHSVFDLDDAIWLTNASESNWMAKYLKRNKNALNCFKWASIVSAGNQFLADEAKKYNKNVVVNPTTAFVPSLGAGGNNATNSNLKPQTSNFIIGWIGSHSTVQYLDELHPVFTELEKKFPFELHVICDVPPKFKLQSMKFIKWSKENEDDDILNFDIGIMPLPDSDWTRGKCGFKAIQYMALGIPAVVSAVGVNPEIVDHEVNGFVCKTKEDWLFYLSKILNDKDCLSKLSAKTKEKIDLRYSVKANAANFLSLFNLNKATGG